MCHIQTDMELTHCDSKTNQDGISENNVLYSKRHATYLLWFHNKTGWNIKK
jgi:hypothetical protein